MNDEMKRLKSLLLSIILLCSVQSYAQIGIQSMEISASTVNVGDTVQITLGIRNYNFSAAYNPTAYPMFVSVGLPAASKILTYASTSLFGSGASVFSSITTYDSFNFTFDLIGSIPPVISGDNVRYVTFKLIAANPNPPGSAPQFLVQLQYPYGDMPGTNPALQSAMSPVFTVNALGAMLVVDATFEPGTFYRRRFTGLVSGANYSMGAWIANYNPPAGDKPNVSFEVYNLSGDLLASANSGDVLTSDWKNFNLIYESDGSDIEIVLRNNTPGTAGNDLAIDDITFSFTPPVPEAEIQAYNCISSSATINVTSPIAIGTFAYEYSIDNVNWQTSTTFTGVPDGPVTVYVRYQSIPACTSTNTITVVPACISISGNVFYDVNGLTDNSVNGPGTNVGGVIYATLFDNTTGEVVASVPVATDGTYTFEATPNNDYSIYIGNLEATVGQTAIPSTTLPSGYVNTGEKNCGITAGCAGDDGLSNGVLNLGVVSSEITQANFGIQEPPTATDNSLPATENPGGTVNHPIPTGSFITADNNGGVVDSIIIPTFPTNVTSITIGTTTYYPTAGDIPGMCPTVTCEVFPGTGVTLPVDASGNPVETVSVDPFDGTVTVEIPYVAIDNGNATSDPSNPATLSIPFNEPTLVSLLQFNATAQQGAALLTWITASEENNRGFNVLHSLDGKEWSNIAFVPTKAIDGNSKTQLSYNYLDQKANLGLNYYRLMQTDVDGKYSYSIIRQVSIAQGAQVNIHPNPTTSLVNIGGLNGSELVVVYDLQGKKMLETKATSQQITLDFSNFVSGVYTIQIVQNNKIVSEKVMKK